MLVTKDCKGCGVTRPLSDFYKHQRALDGLMGVCKECHKQAVKQRRADNPDRAKEIDRRKYLKRREAHLAKNKEYVRENNKAVTEYKRCWAEENEEHLQEYGRAYYQANREATIQRVKEYSQKEQGKEVRRKSLAKWEGNNPHKKRAANMVNNAIRAGRLERGACEICGKKAQGHHEDYSKPLEVRWLCPAHHALVHAELRAAG